MVKNIEIEIKVRIEKSKPLVDFLEKNASFESETRQTDEYFSPPHRSFISVRPVKEWLRLRNDDGVYSINYKKWHFGRGGTAKYADEFETRIADFEIVRKILEILNFQSLVVVDKKRKIWKYGDYEIALDSVKKLGNFVEIEYIGKNKTNHKKITDEMIGFLEGIGCGAIERDNVGYPFLLLFPREEK